MKKLYHGSIMLFDTIDVNAGKGYKDFGKGFYATAVPEHAERLAKRNKEIAVRRQAYIEAKSHLVSTDPIVAYRYNLLFTEDTEDLSVKVFTSADAAWLQFIMMNRKCPESAHDYDIVIGPTADAETTTIINEYYDELESSGYAEEICQEVIDRLKPENLPKQYFFGTEKAIKTVAFNTVKRQAVG